MHSSGADVAMVKLNRRRGGKGEPCHSADLAEMCPVPAQRWQGWPVPAQIRQGCPSSDAHGGLGPTRGGGREPRSVANVARMSEVEAQMHRVSV